MRSRDNKYMRDNNDKPMSRQEKKRARSKRIVEKVLERNKMQRTKMGFYNPEEKTVKLTDSVPLKIYPDEIIFKDIKANQTYEINVLVRNLTKKVKRIRIFQPTSSKFRCDYDMTGPLAPGIALELIVSFSTNVVADFYDEIRILSDKDFEYKIPLHAYAPTANIIFKPFVNMGFVAVGSVKTEMVRFENEGSEEGRVELRYNDLPDFSILTGNQFKLKPGEYLDVELVYEPKEAGIFRGIIEVFVEGQTFLNSIDVNATSVEFLKFVIDEEGNELTNVDFGQVYFGQKKEFKGYLVNNSPKGFNFRVSFVHGLHQDYDENDYLQTPHQVGLEQTQRVMKVFPMQGYIESYGQIPITFTCLCKIMEDHKIWVKNNAFVSSSNEFNGLVKRGGDHMEESGSTLDDEQLNIKDHEYTALFNFEGQDEARVLLMTARSFCPQIKFKENFINFGDCEVNNRRDFHLNVYNYHNNLPLVLECPSRSHFVTSPKKIKLGPGEVKAVTVTFKPKNMGRFKMLLDFVVNKFFDIPLKLMGQSMVQLPKPMKIRGLAATAENFRQKKVEISDTKGNYLTARNFRKVKKMIETTQNTNMPEYSMKPDDTEVIDANQIAKFNKKKYSNYLKSQRVERKRKKKKAFILSQNKARLDRINLYAGLKDDKKREKAYIDVPDTGAANDRLDPPKLEIPTVPDTLYVNKPIAHYEPYFITNSGKQFKPDAQHIFNEFSDKTQSHAEMRDCKLLLSGEKLQRIHVGPTVLDFGDIFVKSVASRYFQIKNELRTSIRAQLLLEDPEVRHSYSKSQIIPSGKIAGFKVVLQSNIEQAFQKPITYVINEKHFFKFMIKANVTLVQLELKKREIDFSFKEEDLSMHVEKMIKIYNYGNDVGQFSWNPSLMGCFDISPSEGSVQPNSYEEVKITYTPSGTKLIEEETLIMNVLDGMRQTIPCKAILNEVKCHFLDKKIDFGTICVSQVKTVTVSLKNSNSRYYAVFKIDADSLPPGLKIKTLQDKIPPEDIYKIDISYCSKDPIELIEAPIKVRLRGSESLTLLISVKTIVPNIVINQDVFDFGEVTYGNSGVLDMYVKNESEIDAVLNLDLRENEKDPDSDGYSKLSIKHIPNENDESIVLEEKEPEDLERTVNKRKPLEPENMLEDMDHEEIDPNLVEEEKSRFYTLKLKSTTTYHFQLVFNPKSHKLYSFNLPLRLAGSNKNEYLMKKVICSGQTPKLIMVPTEGILTFKKKIITSVDNITPVMSTITLTNMNQRERVSFRLDKTEIEKENIFSVIPHKGTIDAQAPVTINVSFKPVGDQKYEAKLPLYLDDNPKPYTEIILRGEGAYPRMLFDRREVIMPVVPLGIKSECTFRIFNEGYQSLNVKHSIANDVGSVKLKMQFPDRTNLSVNQDRIRVRLSFVSKKAISFTTKIIFEDEQKNFYPIYVSGTCDNSILTNYPFFQTQGENYEIVAKDKSSLQLEEIIPDYMSNDSNRPNTEVSKTGSATSKSGKSHLGFSPIPMSSLDSSCKFAKNWIEKFTSINTKIKNFPDSIIEENGVQIFELIEFLTKRSPPEKARIDHGMKKIERIQELYDQYSNLIHFLKENGAMLNTIRPEYLLSYSDLNQYYKTNPNEYATAGANKINEKRYKYISMDAWITIFYQILKIYYLCRVTVKSFRSLVKNIDLPLFPPGYTDTCYIYSLSEIIILRWLEIFLIKNLVLNRRLCNYDSDMEDGLAIGAVTQHYIGGTYKLLFNLKKAPKSEEDKTSNINAVSKALSSDANLELSRMMQKKPSAREMLLFLVHLYQILPHYIPRETLTFPLILGGTCTRNVILQNPSMRKPISYTVYLDRLTHRDFSVDDRELVKIEPGETVSFPVKYTARISKKVKGRITFKSNRQSENQAAALVFDLESDVQGRNSKEQITVKPEVQLYEVNLFEIDVHNDFPSQANFSVRIENIPVIQEESKTKKRRRRRNNKSDSEEDKLFVPAFFCKPEYITIPKNGTYKLPICYLPITLESHKCYIVFSDENIGEMQYEITGQPQPPALFDQVKSIQTHLDSTEPQFLNLSKNNHKLEFALMKLRDMLREVRYLDGAEKKKLIDRLEELRTNVVYHIECDQPFIQTSNYFHMNKKTNANQSHDKSVMSHQSGTMGGSSESVNRIPLNFQYKYPVQNQKVTFLLKNSYKTDVRVYQMKVTVMPKKVRAILEMGVAARIPLEQNIPIINSLDTVSEIKVTMNKIKNANAFRITGLNSNGVYRAPQGMSSLKLIFEPRWMVNSEAKLSLFNKDTNEQFEYDLKGIGEEPLAEEEIYVDCKVREIKEVPIKIKNTHYDNSIFKVTFDLPDAQGNEEIRLLAGQEKVYMLKINATMGGEFTGSITFTNGEGVYYWYMVTYRSESTKKEKHIDIESVCRKKHVEEIELSNPYDEPITFKVLIDSEHLYGSRSITIKPKSKGIYNLKFFPLGEFEDRGTVSFLNDKLGEVVYNVLMISDKPPAVKLPTMKEELGKATYTTVKLTNPINLDVKVMSSVKNAHNFQVVPEKFKIPGDGSIEVKVYYIPSDLDSQESSEVVFTTNEIGSWTYLVFGIGLPPTKFDPTEISGQLKKESTNTLPFKNPFREPISVTVKLEEENDDDKGVFELVLKKPKLQIPPGGTTQIPFTFFPREISEYRADIVVTMNDKISWKYPIVAVTESISNQGDYRFVTQCHVKNEVVKEFDLQGVVNIDPDEVFELYVHLNNKEINSVIKNWLRFEPEKETLNSKDEKLRYICKFHPRKPFKCTGEIIILKPQHGGRWRFKALFESQEPKCDDEIVITSNLNTTSSVKFKLGLPNSRSAQDFVAEFTHDSASEFSVYPKQGKFNPFNRQDTVFMVSYTPVEYGKVKIGKLIIQTKEYYWNFMIKGTFPKYKPPAFKKSRIDNKLDKRTEQLMKRRIKSNTRQSANKFGNV